MKVLSKRVIKKVMNLVECVPLENAESLKAAVNKDYLETARERHKAINEMIKEIRGMQEYLEMLTPSDNLLLQSVRVSTRLETLLCVYERILDGYEWEEMPFEMYLGGKNEL